MVALKLAMVMAKSWNQRMKFQDHFYLGVVMEQEKLERCLRFLATHDDIFNWGENSSVRLEGRKMIVSVWNIWLWRVWEMGERVWMWNSVKTFGQERKDLEVVGKKVAIKVGDLFLQQLLRQLLLSLFSEVESKIWRALIRRGFAQNLRIMEPGFLTCAFLFHTTVLG